VTGTVRAIVPQCSRMPRRFAAPCPELQFTAAHFTVVVLTNRDAPEPYGLALAKIYLPDADAQRAAGTATGPDPLARPLPPRSQ
jgi:hypothetical protein